MRSSTRYFFCILVYEIGNILIFSTLRFVSVNITRYKGATYNILLIAMNLNNMTCDIY